jgi:hypothetical protein
LLLAVQAFKTHSPRKEAQTQDGVAPAQKKKKRRRGAANK